MKGKSRKPEREEMLRYLEGRMSDEERNAFERTLQSDLFYSDAVEGYQSLAGEDHARDLLDLDQQLNRRIQKQSTSRTGITWVRVAASVAILLAVSSVILVLLRNNPDLSRRIARDTAPEKERTEEVKGPRITEEPEPEGVISTQKEESGQVDETRMQEAAEVRSEPADIISVEKPEEKQEEIAEEVPKEATETAELKEGYMVIVAEDEEMADDMVEMDQVAGAGKGTDTSFKELNLEVTEEIMAEQAVQTRQIEATHSRAKAAPVATLTSDEKGDQAGSRILTGVVRSNEDSSPVPGAVLLLKPSNTGTVSENDGRFSIEVSSEDDLLLASFIGMETQELEIPDMDYLLIYMDPDVIALEEVVVIGYGITRETKALGYAVIQAEEEEKQGYIPAEPEGGYELFKNYIEENMQFPGVPGIENAIVVLNFTVPLSGKPSDIRVIRSPSQVFSDEAIRLLVEGPEWKPAEQDGRVFETGKRIRIVFRK